MYWSFFLSLNICYDILLWFVVVTFSPPLPFLLQLHLFKFTCWCCNFLALCFVSALFLLTSTNLCTWENDGSISGSQHCAGMVVYTSNGVCGQTQPNSLHNQSHGSRDWQTADHAKACHPSRRRFQVAWHSREGGNCPKINWVCWTSRYSEL